MIRTLILLWTCLIINYVSVDGVLRGASDLSSPHHYNNIGWKPFTPYFQQIPQYKTNNNPRRRHIKNNRIQSYDPLPERKTKYESIRSQRIRQRQDSNSTITEMEEKEVCNGFDNILNDMGIMSLVLGIIGAVLGIITAEFSIGGIVISSLSVLWAGGPSTILHLLDRFLAYQNQQIAGVVGMTGVLDTILNVFWNIPFSTLNTIGSEVGNVVSVVSILLGIFALFPEQVEDALNFVFGKVFVKQSGCNNPYKEVAEMISSVMA